MRAALTALLILVLPLQALGFETNARSAWVYDVGTGTVLLAKDAERPLPPASMSKLMTLYMLFEAVRDGRMDMDTRLPVSGKARQMGGSTMFLNEQDRPTVEELIKGIIVLSGNDACVVVAEGLAGTEEAFARQMNDRAAALGMNESHFINSSGWPHPDHKMSMHDLGIVAERLIEDFPELYKYFALTEFPYDNRAPANRFNRNPLLKLGIGADGLKTGHTQEAGYGLVGSAVQGGRRVIFVISGLDSERQRAEEAERITAWAFRDFTMKEVVPQGETVVTVPVWLGSKSNVALTTSAGLNVLVPVGAEAGVTAEAVFTGPIEAPVARGDRLGTLQIQIPGVGPANVPLVAAEDIEAAGFVGRLRGAAMRLGGDAISMIRQ
ncbi:MAG: D-alanyl-D-alanine carboxypeptidase family protein [Paracoccus sp. (in: a-proteobacteria)]|nr:D-alanyl-D-alanine carboxypeptidase family protein [Paracoccus sp. (in: a-proteobacteria)]